MEYDFSFNAGGGQDISAGGTYIKYKSGLGAIRVRFSTGGYLDLTPGQGARLDKAFGGVNVQDKSGNANAGVLVIGGEGFQFQDDTIAGVVSIVDGGKNSTLSKNCFLATMDMGTVAANYNAALLINPAGSPKNLIVESITVSGASAWISMHMLGIVPAGSVHGQNKYAALVGGVPSIAFVESNFANSMAFFLTPFQRAAVGTNLQMNRKFAEPLIIPPGMAVAVVNNTVAASGQVDFEWREDPI